MMHTFRPWRVRLVAVVTISAASAACDANVTSVSDRASSSVVAARAESPRAVELGSCSNLAVPDGERVSAHLYAAGTQNYMWMGTTWYFVGPTAELYANARGDGKVGIHYAGPTWVSKSGSGVVGRVVDKCTPDAGAIPWLLLSAVSSRGPGIFEGTTYIQRIHTTGGLAPTTPGTAYGDMARVPYTAEYAFYR